MPKRTGLNQVERDLVQFLAERQSAPPEEIARRYLRLRSRYRFSTIAYRDLCSDMHDLASLFFDEKREGDLIEAYRQHAPLHLLRFVSYSFPDSGGITDYARAAVRRAARGELDELVEGVRHVVRRRGHSHGGHGFRETAEMLLRHAEGTPVVVDYGCGLAYVSYEIARLRPEAEAHLVDVDCLTLEFAAYRFSAAGMKAARIPVTRSKVYPRLPAHNICVATEVLEHVARPMTAYRRILDGLAPGGILYGDFEDHHDEALHVSPTLAPVRERLAHDFDQIGERLYRRRSAT